MRFDAVFVPFSAKSFNGIKNDVVERLGNPEVIALVLEGEEPPAGVRCLRVMRDGTPGLIALERGQRRAVVANGGPTPLGVAAVLLAQRLGCALLNVQRDEIIALNRQAEF
jgi:hypothetical protein